MARVSGRVNSFKEALIEVGLNNGATLNCVIDTGFDGGLMVPKVFAARNEIPTFGHLAFETVGGARMYAAVGLAEIEWMGKMRPTEMIISEANDALIGTELLARTTLTVDYVTRIVTISTEDSHE